MTGLGAAGMVSAMTIRRIIALILFAAALLFGAADLWHGYFPAYGSDEITMGRLWLLVSAHSLDVIEDLMQRHLWAPIWELVISPVLLAPAWSFFGLLGIAFFAFGRPKVVER
jgi:hypothetical protein